jgi:plasmid stabilization system protein ParE
MARLKLRNTPLAIDDLEHAYDFIGADSLGAAATTLERTEATIERLRSFPRMGRVGRITGTREIAVNRTHL